MRTLFIGLLAIGLFSLTSCKQETDTQALLENPETRTEVFNSIVENDAYMAEFMESMHGNLATMKMMQGNKKMMGSMMNGQGMQMMMKDSTMMHSMMNRMMGDGKMMGNMMKMMHETGMMSEDCMESCSMMMKDKGMDMMYMNNGIENNHSEHH